MRRVRRLVAWVVCTACIAILGTMSASGGDEAVADVAIERRAVELGELLRCLVCQNQTIADSNADLALDLKRQIREQLRAGRSESEIIDFMVERYGDFVLYRPPLRGSTVALWFGPAVIAIGGVVVAVLMIRRTRAAGARDELREDDRARAAALLRDGARPEGPEA